MKINRIWLAIGILVVFLASASNAAEFAANKSCYASGYFARGCSYAIDSSNLSNSEWVTNNATLTWQNMTVDLNDTYVYNVTNVAVFTYNLTMGIYYQNLQVFYSNDNFTTQTLAGAITGVAGEYRVFNFTAGIQARYWRLVVNSPFGDGINGYVRDLAVYGTVVGAGNVSSAVINVPLNGTYFPTFATNFSYWSDHAVLANCTRYLDGVYYASGNIANASEGSDALASLTAGSHSYNVTCRNATAATGSNVTYFTVVSNATLVNCTSSTSKILTMFLRDELNDSVIWNGTIEIDPEIYWNAPNGTSVYLGNFPFYFNLTALGHSGANNASICISPNYSTVLFSDFIVYYAPSYSQRSYSLYTNLSNVTTNLYLYLLQATLTDEVIVYVKDENGQNVGADYDVWIQKYFVGNVSYKTVAMVKTDYEGKGTTYLATADTYYRFLISVNGTILATIPPTIIVCASGVCPPYVITLQISQLNAPYYLKTFGNIQAGCVYNNASTVLSCLASDSTGATVNANLLVKLRNAMNFSHICDNNCASSSCTITCNLSAFTPLGNVTNHFYQYYFTGWQGSAVNLIVFDEGTLDFGSALFNWGDGSLLLAFLIVAVMFAVGLWNPVVSITLGCVGLIAAWLVGIAFVQLPALIGIIIVGALIAWKLKT